MGMEKEKTKKSKVIIITGMHRSGTTGGQPDVKRGC